MRGGKGGEERGRHTDKEWQTERVEREAQRMGKKVGDCDACMAPYSGCRVPLLSSLSISNSLPCDIPFDCPTHPLRDPQRA